MQNQKYTDKILEKIDRQTIVKLHRDGLEPEQIQKEMWISLRYINQVIAEYQDEQARLLNGILNDSSCGE